MSEQETVKQTIRKVNAYYEALEKESPRGAAVLALARFEYRLCEAIEEKLVNSDHKLDLGRMPAHRRIELGYALGLIDQKTRNDLQQKVLPIRNRFAHRADVLDFDDERVQEWCLKLDVGVPNSRDARFRYLAYLWKAEIDLMRTSIDLPGFD